jgi:hypothetical protein
MWPAPSPDLLSFESSPSLPARLPLPLPASLVPAPWLTRRAAALWSGDGDFDAPLWPFVPFVPFIGDLGGPLNPPCDSISVFVKLSDDLNDPLGSGDFDERSKAFRGILGERFGESDALLSDGADWRGNFEVSRGDDNCRLRVCRGGSFSRCATPLGYSEFSSRAYGRMCTKKRAHHFFTFQNGRMGQGATQELKAYKRTSFGS